MTRNRSLLALVLGAGTLGVLLQANAGDYGQDAGPSLSALASGHIGRALELQPLMGSFSILVRAPFAVAAHLAGLGQYGMYMAGALPCLAALVALGVYLVRRRGLDGMRAGELLVPLLAVLTPASIDAFRSGHPEEALAGALVVVALLLADRDQLWSAVALGLALATKQWALVAVAPVLWATPSGRRGRTAAIAAGVAAALTVPLALGSLTAFTHTSYNAATSTHVSARATLWFLVAHPRDLALHLGPGFPTHITAYVLPEWVRRGSHPLIVVIAPLLTLALWRRRPTTADALALLAFVLLLRCVLDPVDNEYYHLPFLLALLAFEWVGRRDFRGIPVMTLFSAAGLWLTFDRLDTGGAAPQLTNAVYLCWTAAAALYLLWGLGLRPRVSVHRPALEPVAHA